MTNRSRCRLNAFSFRSMRERNKLKMKNECKQISNWLRYPITFSPPLSKHIRKWATNNKRRIRWNVRERRGRGYDGWRESKNATHSKRMSKMKCVGCMANDVINWIAGSQDNEFFLSPNKGNPALAIPYLSLSFSLIPTHCQSLLPAHTCSYVHTTSVLIFWRLFHLIWICASGLTIVQNIHTHIPLAAYAVLQIVCLYNIGTSIFFQSLFHIHA